MANFTALERQMKAVANAKRIHVLQFLKKSKSSTVTNISKELGMTIQATSKHLRQLKNANIIEGRKRGLLVTHRLSLHQEEPIKKLISLL